MPACSILFTYLINGIKTGRTIKKDENELVNQRLLLKVYNTSNIMITFFYIFLNL